MYGFDKVCYVYSKLAKREEFSLKYFTVRLIEEHLKIPELIKKIIFVLKKDGLGMFVDTKYHISQSMGAPRTVKVAELVFDKCFLLWVQLNPELKTAVIISTLLIKNFSYRIHTLANLTHHTFFNDIRVFELW